VNNNEPIPGKYTLPAIAVTAPAIATAAAAPLTTLTSIGTGMIAGKGVDELSKAATDKTFGENISNWTGLDQTSK